MREQILVTGGAGFIGSHLVDALLDRGANVVVLDDFSTGSRENLDRASIGSLKIIEGSVLDEDALDEATAGCSRVFHLAVQCVRRSLGDPMESHQVNATGTLLALEAARRQRVARFVYCSSSEVYGNTSTGLLSEEETVARPATVYGGAKLAGEHYASAYHETYGLPTVVVRPFNAYGPRAPHSGQRAEVIPRFLIRALAGQAPVIFGDGTNGRDFTYVTDIAAGLVLAGFADNVVGRKINIAYGRMITIREVANAILRAVGRNDLSVELGAPRPGDVHQLNADTRLAKQLLGYEASITFQDGLDRHIRWFKHRFPDPSSLIEDQVENWTLPDQMQGRAPSRQGEQQ